LLDAIRWLTGQMPQMRAVIEGISVSGRPSHELLEPTELGDVEQCASSTLPASSRVMVILRVTFDSGHRFNGYVFGHGGFPYWALHAEAGQ
jgi:hypothetical protein